ncbi:hypothetical protein [Vibrio breoganii]|uniref:hypothetical protein n=1 Tax=Vibrio breoganii TaxID=553239 RepID=UPI000C81AF0B|nr:hypothetical protein [Vibrio breoganii]PMM26364.1 hypothetical protein BCT59_02665 [Vibrio breoganii]
MLFTHAPTPIFKFYCDSNESANDILNATLSGDELLEHLVDGTEAIYDEERMQALHHAVQLGLVTDPRAVRLVTY